MTELAGETAKALGREESEVSLASLYTREQRKPRSELDNGTRWGYNIINNKSFDESLAQRKIIYGFTLRHGYFRVMGLLFIIIAESPFARLAFVYDEALYQST